MTSQQQVLTIAVVAHTTHTVVRPAGEIDAGTSPQLQATLIDVADTSDGRDVVIDLGDVTFIDSSGISALVTLRHEFDARGQGFTICHVSSQVDRVLDLCGVAEWLTRSRAESTR